jgi:hypothetical protein
MQATEIKTPRPSGSQESRQDKIQSCVSVCLKALEGLSNSEAMLALKQVLAVYNSHPVSNFAPQGLSSQSVPRVSRPIGRARARPKVENTSPEVQALKKDLNLIQSKIRAEARSYRGGVLPRDHALIQQRDSLLAQIVRAKSSFRRLPSDEKNDSSPAKPEQESLES